MARYQAEVELYHSTATIERLLIEMNTIRALCAEQTERLITQRTQLLSANKEVAGLMLENTRLRCQVRGLLAAAQTACPAADRLQQELIAGVVGVPSFKPIEGE